MTDVELLFVVLAVIYLWECACWIPRGSIAFLTWTERSWRLAVPSVIAGNQRGGFVFAPPLPPLGTILVANPLPVSISPDSVLGYVSTTLDPGGRAQQTGRLASFEEIKKIEVRGRKLLLDRELFVRPGSSGQAAWLAERLAQIAKVGRGQREKKIRELFDETLDVKQIKSKWDEFKKQTGTLRLLANAVFCYLFIFAPALIYHFSLHATWLRLLIGLFGLTFYTAFYFRKVHKMFYPKADDERFTHFLTTMLSPATTPRARDILSRRLFEWFHPVAVTKVLCSEAVFKELAGRALRDARHPALPVFPGKDAVARDTENYSRSLWQRSLEEFLRRSGLDIGKLMQAPVPADRTSLAYCPRCLAQFTSGSEQCADCGGLELVKW